MKDFKLVTYTDNEELELEWTIKYCISGKNRPATFYDPAEYEEIEILATKLESIKVSYSIQTITYSSFIPLNLLNIELLEKTLPDPDSLEALCWEDDEQREQAWADDYDY